MDIETVYVHELTAHAVSNTLSIGPSPWVFPQHVFFYFPLSKAIKRGVQNRSSLFFSRPGFIKVILPSYASVTQHRFFADDSSDVIDDDD